ncbi:hypothetical protein [Cryptosporangium aurantiacum]|uniref:SMODS-associated NUDIX domain-containing protein n=1 Tax=Cryptosporangium aurantiacum TaxID=134849 RepID=UPI0015BA5074|nr:hypothetical protein [Cryptosporangium aurantiacum]
MNPGVGPGGVVVILTALELEHRAVHRHLRRVHTVVHPAGTIFDVGELEGSTIRVALAVTGPGNTGAGILAERSIAMFAPSAVFFVGVAGSLATDIDLGDVVFATRVYFYQGGLESPTGFSPRPAAWPAPHRIEQLARHVSRTGQFGTTVHFRPIAAGDVVLDSLDGPLIARIRQNYNDAAAVEMESAGLHQAGQLNESLPVLTVRGVSDRADGKKELADRRGLQHRAADTAAAFAVALCRALESGPGPPATVAESVRISTAALLRVRDDDRFILFHSPTRPGAYGPPGGVVKLRSSDALEAVGFRAEPRRNSAMHGDLRGFVPGIALGDFLRWWRTGADRESAPDCLRRELVEELAEIGRPDLAPEVDDVPLTPVRSVVDGPWSVPAAPYDQLRVFEVYDLAPGDARAERFRRTLTGLADDPAEPSVIWADRTDIEYGRCGPHYITPPSAFLFGDRRIHPDLPMLR